MVRPAIQICPVNFTQGKGKGIRFHRGSIRDRGNSFRKSKLNHERLGNALKFKGNLCGVEFADRNNIEWETKGVRKKWGGDCGSRGGDHFLDNRRFK
jgi:hypothetical protein